MKINIKNIIIPVVFVFFVIIPICNNIKNINKAKKDVQVDINEINIEIEKYNIKKKKLEQDISKSNEEKKIEKIARDRLNLKKEGEVTYKIVD